MIYLRLFLLFSLFLFSTTSCQSLDKSFSAKPSQNKTLANAAIDLHYLDGCTAILKGFEDIFPHEASYSRYFAEWENTNPKKTVRFNSKIVD